MKPTNKIPDKWRTHDGCRSVSPVGCMMGEVRLEQFQCPKCGKPGLIDIEVEKDDQGFPIYQVVCPHCDWHAPESTKSDDCGDAIGNFKDWLEGYYLSDGLNRDAGLSYNYAEFLEEPITPTQEKAISKRKIPSKYLFDESGKRTISPIGRIIANVPLAKIRCPSCMHWGTIHTVDRSNFLVSPLPLCEMSCYCGWHLPSGISKSPDCAAADLRLWMEAWCLLGCQESMVNEDVTQKLSENTQKLSEKTARCKLVAEKDLTALETALKRLDSIMLEIQKKHPEVQLYFNDHCASLINTSNNDALLTDETGAAVLDYLFQSRVDAGGL